jgi:hypothetical protein
MEVIISQVEKECSMLCWRQQPSELRKNDFPSMSTFTWDKLTDEMVSRCPLLLDILLTAMGYSKDNIDEIVPRLSLCYAILLQSRNHELTLVQRLNTILMTNGNAKKQVWYVKYLVLKLCEKFSLFNTRITENIINTNKILVKRVFERKQFLGTQI